MSDMRKREREEEEEDEEEEKSAALDGEEAAAGCGLRAGNAIRLPAKVQEEGGECARVWVGSCVYVCYRCLGAGCMCVRITAQID